MKLLLIDGHGLAYRSYFAMIRNPLFNSRGENTSAEFGFLRTLLQLKRDEEPEAILVCFDPKGKTFRHEMEPAYKANRPKMPDDLRSSIERLRRFLNMAGFPQLSREGYEADDLLASVSRKAEQEGWEVRLFSADKDLCQLASDSIRILKPASGKKPARCLGPEEVEEDFGVLPALLLDYLSLIGDSSDNIEGVKGLGPKGALKLLKEHGGLDAVLDSAEQASSPALRTKLLEGRENALHARELIRLRDDLEVDSPGEWILEGGNPEETRGWLQDRDFHSLVPEFLGEEAPTCGEVDYSIIQSREALADLVQSLREVGCFALDTETTDLDPMKAQLVGISFSFEEGRAFYLPLDGDAGNECLSLDSAREILCELLSDDKLVKIGQNIKYDSQVLVNNGIPVSGPVEDTMLMSYCLDSSRRSHGLDALARDHLSHEMIPWSSLFEKGDREKDIRKVPLGRLAEYAAEDADFTFRLWLNLASSMKEDPDAEKLYRELELPLLPILSQMERQGIALDLPHLQALSERMEEEIQATQTRIHEQAGREFSIGSPKQLSSILFEELNLPTGRRTKTGFSTDEEVLRKLSEEHEIATEVLRWRELSKLKGTYVDTLPLQVNEQTSRVHTRFNQAVASTGRLSSSDPNLQNIPIRSELGKEIRRAFIAEEGLRLLSMDYSQVELRILAHLCGDEALMKAFREDRDIHRWTSSRILGKEESEVSREERDRAKVVNYGVLYGMGARGMAQRLGIGVEEAQSFIDEYFSAFPAILSWKEELLQRARIEKSVTTLLGRRRPLPEIQSSNGRIRSFAERAAINSPIQGSAADMIKVAMLRVQEVLASTPSDCHLLLQVHDELLFELPPEQIPELSPLLKQAMEEVYPLDLPLLVQCGEGHNWLEAH
jgi:DNA polymerase-1